MMHMRHTSRVLASLFLLTYLSSAHSLSAEEGPDLATRFQGNWDMQGRFRSTPEMDWIPTRSTLQAVPKLGNHAVLRDIVAPQIGFAALDLLTYNPSTGVAQYIYVNNQSTSALIFEGSCREGCSQLEFEQVCGAAWTGPSCDGKTTISFESEDRFVARDFRPGADGKPFMTREVYYSRSEAEVEPSLSALEGTWSVDLRPTPDSEPYYQEMVVSSVGDKVEGTFYGAPFREFRANTLWGEVHFAFVTEDGSGVYHTTGRLEEGRLRGTTHSLGRDFFSVWSAERKGSPAPN